MADPLDNLSLMKDFCCCNFDYDDLNEKTLNVSVSIAGFNLNLIQMRQLRDWLIRIINIIELFTEGKMPMTLKR